MNTKLTEKLQVLLTSSEVNQINWVILNEALSKQCQTKTGFCFYQRVNSRRIKT